MATEADQPASQPAWLYTWGWGEALDEEIGQFYQLSDYGAFMPVFFSPGFLPCR